jgi:hypothetical protein
MTRLEQMLGRTESVRIALLLDHSAPGDSRVLSQIDAFHRAGAEVALFHLQRSGQTDLKPTDERANVSTIGIPFDNALMVPIIATINTLRRKQASTPLKQNRDPAVPNPQTRPINHTQAPQRKPDREIQLNRKTPSSPRQVWTARINRTLSALFWHRAMAKSFLPALLVFKPDLIIANDLATLGAGTQAAKRLKAKLIYDAHEYEKGRNGVAGTLAEAIRIEYEAPLIRQADAVVTVGVAIARLLQKDYRLPRIPATILNAASETTEHRLNGDAEQSAPPPAKHGKPTALFTGSVADGRGLDMAMRAIKDSAIPINLSVLSRVSDDQAQNLKRLAASAAIASSFKVLPSVDPGEVVATMRKADLSIIPIQESCTSYRYAVPNKLFQALKAGHPIVSTPLPEVAAILRTIGGHHISQNFDAKAFADSIAVALEANPQAETNTELIKTAYSQQNAQMAWLTIAAQLLNDEPIQDLPALPHANAIDLQPDALKKVKNGPPRWKRRVGKCVIRLARLLGLRP